MYDMPGVYMLVSILRSDRRAAFVCIMQEVLIYTTYHINIHMYSAQSLKHVYT